MLGPTEVRRVCRYDIRSKFDVIPTLHATYSSDYIQKLFTLTKDLLTSLGIDDCHALYEQIMRDLGEALTNRERAMTFLHAFVMFFEPHDSGRLSLFARYRYFGHVEALSILKCLIIMNEEETHERHSIPFLFHPTTNYSILGRLCDDGRVGQAKQQFLNNTEFQAAIIEAANHLTAIKVCFDELVMILGVEVDEANNCIVAGKWDVPADSPTMHSLSFIALSLMCLHLIDQWPEMMWVTFLRVLTRTCLDNVIPQTFRERIMSGLTKYFVFVTSTFLRLKTVRRYRQLVE